MNCKMNHKWIFRIFLILESIIYIRFLYLDISRNENYDLIAYIKYSGIVLCVIFQFLYYWKQKNDTIILRFAILGTAFADYFLVIAEDNTPGVLMFMIVQLLYMVRITNIDRTKENKIRVLSFRYIMILLNTSVISMILLYFKVYVDFLFMITCIYFQSLVVNVVCAVKITVKNKKVTSNRIFAIGMVLFLLCDINVGLFNLSQYMTLQDGIYLAIYNISSIAMWLFYLPSQVMISISESRDR
ncbi:hypothetical protein [Anaeromicropila herbilytica]|uniref:YhhN-like protein n=1 Tax=Anaeromicropila herbilytica TaxID=2785025 RepID=A0A7R7ENC9_9FIRM|nr:hypothetical protein [Anaeromicropila herbilytica]BCN31697.1 hypothetical protein bsdtb5_29920 [Anaeromicropila herbilytica]